MSAFIPLANYFNGIGKQKIILLAYALGFITTLSLAPGMIQTYQVTGAVFTANVSALIMALVLTLAFIISNKFSLSRCFLINKDLLYLKLLIKNK